MLPGFLTVDGVTIRYVESSGPAEHAIVLTSPWPESVYAFDPIWAALAEHGRLFAVDLPGFGGTAAAEYASFVADWVTHGYRNAITDLGRSR